MDDRIAEAFEKQGYIMFKRKNHCDVLAVRELNRNYTHALELLIENRLCPDKILKVLVAQGFYIKLKTCISTRPRSF